MEIRTSSEDVFDDALSMNSRYASRRTIYHSAEDLSEMDDNMAEHTNLYVTTPSSQTAFDVEHPKPCSMVFSDGRRTVDFVLAWWKPVIKHNSPNNAAQLAAAEEAQKKRQTFEQNLIKEGLELEYETNSRLSFVKIHAPREVLRRYCDVLKLRMPMKRLPEQDELFRERHDLMNDVKSFFSETFFKWVSVDEKIFPKSKFQPSAEYSKDKSYLFDEDAEDFFDGPVRTIIVDFILERQRFSDDPSAVSAVGIQRLIVESVYSAAYPLHDGDYRVDGCLRYLLYREWAQVRHWYKTQPIDHVKDYFGVKYGLYFAWLGFYTHMLIPASFVGLLCFLYGCFTVYSNQYSNDICDHSQNITMCPLCDRTCDYWKLSDTCTYARITYLFDNPVTVFFAVFMSFWATLFLELWKRYSASITHRWGLTGFTLRAEHPRPQYLARLKNAKKYKINIITGLKEPCAPFWTARVPATLLSFSVVLLLISLAVGTVFGVVLYRMSVRTVLTSLKWMVEDEWTATHTLLLIPTTAALLNLVFIMVFNYIYDRLAVYLTELELWRTQTEFDESLTIKIYLFQFVNYYTSIMYIAFLKGKFVGYPKKYNRVFGFRQEECSPGGCLMELCIQLAIIMVGQQTFNSILEMILPYMYKLWNTFMVSTGLETKQETQDDVTETADAEQTNQWTEDYKLLDWGTRGLFDEYLEMVMQYGFVTIFVTAFPLAPLFALMNNVFEMRLDAKKFLTFYRRPIPRQAPNIGVWFRILDVLGKVAVISNAFIIAFSSNFIPRLIYMMSVNKVDHTDVGFLNYSLAVFNTSDFPPGLGPIAATSNVSICRYAQYREPPEGRYKRTPVYWQILAARLLFVVLFQNIVSLVMIAVQWCIPDVPSRLRDQIKHEALLTNELIIRQEARRAKLSNSVQPQNFDKTSNGGVGDTVRQRHKDGVEDAEPDSIEMKEIVASIM
ncbi:anoctamin-1-like isoform X2 [Lycorma delicatula]|uniref:anoctamin-1-like isoform X2 n=1 Tax=Lycorma delicatula TaxID=130591 RepID=UPI003F518A76